jgi:hypothetical protein
MPLTRPMYCCIAKAIWSTTLKFLQVPASIYTRPLECVVTSNMKMPTSYHIFKYRKLVDRLLQTLLQTNFIYLSICSWKRVLLRGVWAVRSSPTKTFTVLHKHTVHNTLKCLNFLQFSAGLLLFVTSHSTIVNSNISILNWIGCKS